MDLLTVFLVKNDCLTTTNGYNYLAINDDVWVYTGVTSITSDQSNVGFVLMNQRTMETKYYEIEGAIEDSAMTSAEGKVQNLGYKATFPLLLNIDAEPTYFMALKSMPLDLSKKLCYGKCTQLPDCSNRRYRK